MAMKFLIISTCSILMFYTDAFGSNEDPSQLLALRIREKIVRAFTTRPTDSGTIKSGLFGNYVESLGELLSIIPQKTGLLDLVRVEYARAQQMLDFCRSHTVYENDWPRSTNMIRIFGTFEYYDSQRYQLRDLDIFRINTLRFWNNIKNLLGKDFNVERIDSSISVSLASCATKLNTLE